MVRQHDTVNDVTTGRPATNWAGNYSYRAAAFHRPTTLDELCRIVSSSSNLRVLGSRHSFTDIVDAEELVDLRSLPQHSTVDIDAGTVTVSGASTYAAVAELLRPRGLALHNLASLPHISVAGAIATATHGSGVANGNLASAVSAVTVVDAAGELRRFDRSHADFNGAVVSLGALGPVVDVTVDLVPTFDIAQTVYEDLPLDLACDHLAEILASAYSASIFTTFRDAEPLGNVWLKRRVDTPADAGAVGDELFGASPARVAHHPVPGLDATGCTEQLGQPGLWSDRLPHFKMGFSPSAGDEVQSEFFVDTARGPEALAALCSAAPGFTDQLMVAEVRAIAADDLWMSPQYTRSTVAFHFTWRPDGLAGGELERAIRAVEAVLLPFDAVPHWGKVFFADLDIAARFERFGDYVRLLDDVDPDGVFRNEWCHRVISR